MYLLVYGYIKTTIVFFNFICFWMPIITNFCFCVSFGHKCEFSGTLIGFRILLDVIFKRFSNKLVRTLKLIVVRSSRFPPHQRFPCFPSKPMTLSALGEKTLSFGLGWLRTNISFELSFRCRIIFLLAFTVYSNHVSAVREVHGNYLRKTYSFALF